MKTNRRNELINKYIDLYYQSMDRKRFPGKPKHVPPGVSWTTKEFNQLMREMEDILEEIQLNAVRSFIKDVNEVMNSDTL